MFLALTALFSHITRHSDIRINGKTRHHNFGSHIEDMVWIRFVLWLYVFDFVFVSF